MTAGEIQGRSEDGCELPDLNDLVMTEKNVVVLRNSGVKGRHVFTMLSSASEEMVWGYTPITYMYAR